MASQDLPCRRPSLLDSQGGVAIADLVGRTAEVLALEFTRGASTEELTDLQKILYRLAVYKLSVALNSTGPKFSSVETRAWRMLAGTQLSGRHFVSRGLIRLLKMGWDIRESARHSRHAGDLLDWSLLTVRTPRGVILTFARDSRRRAFLQDMFMRQGLVVRNALDAAQRTQIREESTDVGRRTLGVIPRIRAEIDQAKSLLEATGSDAFLALEGDHHVESLLAAGARELGLRSACIQWGSVLAPRPRPGLRHLPYDEFWARTEVEAQLIRTSTPNVSMRVVPLLQQAMPSTRALRVLFVSQPPAAGVVSASSRSQLEHFSLRVAQRLRHEGDLLAETVVAWRPHPSEGEAMPMMSFGHLTTSKVRDPLEDVAASQVVIGLNSSLMSEACLLGVPTLSLRTDANDPWLTVDSCGSRISRLNPDQLECALVAILKAAASSAAEQQSQATPVTIQVAHGYGEALREAVLHLTGTHRP